MTTTVDADTFGGIDLLASTQSTQSEGGSADCTVPTEGSGTRCVFEEACSINPKKIAFIPFDSENPQSTPTGSQYQCNVTCAGSQCFD